MDKTTEVAIAFAKRMSEVLTPEQMRSVRRRNAWQTNSNVCHSHDYIDANELMAAALRKCGIATPLEMPDATMEIWNAAWKKAKSAGFDPAKVKP